MLTLTSKQRAYLKGLASEEESLFQVGKAGVTPQVTAMVEELFHTHELIKGTVLKSCEEDLREVAQMIAERTHAVRVHTIGRKIVLYKPFAEEPEIVLPK